MSAMKVEQISIKNFKMFKDASVKHLPTMCVFVGANGAGKSTFFDIFGFLSDALKENVSIAINRRGGFKELITRGSDEKDLIEIEIKFRNPEEKSSPLITYQLKVGQKNGRIAVETEILKYRRGKHGQPWHFLSFHDGKGTAIRNEEQYGQEGAQEDREEQTLSAPDILAIKGLGQFERFKAISSFRKLLEGWYVSNLQIEAAKVIGDIGFAQHLSSRGENLAQVTKYIYENHKDIFDTICKKMSERVPGIGSVEAIQSEAGQIILKFKDGSFKDPFISRYVSDGTLKMFAYLVLLHDPQPHPLLCIEEPENFLYPKLLSELVEELRQYSFRGGQVLITTHSPDFVNVLEIDELFCIAKKQGISTISKAKDIEMVASLSEKGEKLGQLWQRGYFREGGML
jgi:predicted ATPase